jgi:hypothetical protein
MIDIVEDKKNTAAKDKFYTNKRKIIREAEQLGKKYDCDVFLFIH